MPRVFLACFLPSMELEVLRFFLGRAALAPERRGERVCGKERVVLRIIRFPIS
jgi:hypothetical protein